MDFKKQKPKLQGVLFQAFQWFNAAEENLWLALSKRAPELSRAGITAVWIPPMYKGSRGQEDAGYAVYDLWDLGEFEQKGTTRTKYGTKAELIEAINSCKQSGMLVYGDIVLNHKDGGDEVEEFEAWEVHEEDRGKPITGKQHIGAYTNFHFPGRSGKYSEFKWSWRHFAWVGHHKTDERVENKVFQIKDILWQDEINDEKGNFDFLLGCDIDHGDNQVREDLFKWGLWLLQELKLDGFRLDALKHIRISFFNDWLDAMRKDSGRELPAVGELWSADLATLENYIERTSRRMSLFDVPLHFNFHKASIEGNTFNLAGIFENTLVSKEPLLAVTFVDNHDTQPLCSLESAVLDWFKPLAYALILLRKDGYPTVFLGDYDGGKYNFNDKSVELIAHKEMINIFLQVRKNYTFGEQCDYFDHPQCIGWITKGDKIRPKGIAVIMSSGEEGTKKMNTGVTNARYLDATTHFDYEIVSDDNGEAEFRCPAGKVSVWIQQ